MNQLTKLQKISVVYVVGCCIQVVSLFLPWYTYKITTDTSQSGWNFYLFEQWKPIHVIQPLIADLPLFRSAIIFAIMNAFYFGVGISLALVFLIKRDPTHNQEISIQMFMLCGPVISVALQWMFLISCVIFRLYIPYLQIQMVNGAISLTKTYSLSCGCGLCLLATTFLFVPISKMDLSTILTLPKLSSLRSSEKEVLNPHFVDVQKMEDKYLSLYAQQEEEKSV
ncbi:MAG: hypothetical protein JW776_04435 [Candidatus Lokiarchaeota archaeon]|nr:hypothetical protein [Candidatus Lokiarchaeota archaeon]